MKQINTKQDCFFGDTVDKNKLIEFNQNLFLINKHRFINYFRTISRANEEKNYVFHTQLGYFKSIQDARDYFNEQTNSTELIRLQSREWNQQNEILSKSVITDQNGNIQIVLLNCLEQVCERFGGKCDEEVGCSTVPFAQEYAKNKRQIPINPFDKEAN